VNDDRRSRIRELRGVYLVLTSPRIPHVDLAAAAVERRVPVIQLREKDLDDAALTELARSLVEVTAGSDTLFIVNDRPDVAALVSADGVHVGASDTDPLKARALVGPSAIVGVSANTPAEIARARDAGTDYVGIGPVFATTTKPDASEPIGLSGLADAARAFPGLPTVAIGGITAENAAGVLAAGAEFVAVISEVCFAPDPIEALDRLLTAVRSSDPWTAGPRVAETAPELDPTYDIDGQVNFEGLRYCPRCAAELRGHTVRGHRRLSCPKCSYVFYMTPAPVTCVIVQRDGAILMVRRRYPPRTGEWCLPAGFIEQGESPHESAVREVKEETGLDVVITEFLDSWATAEDPRTPIVSFAFAARIVGGTLAPGDDADRAQFFERDSLPEEIAFTTHRDVIEEYLRNHDGSQTRR